VVAGAVAVEAAEVEGAVGAVVAAEAAAEAVVAEADHPR
jgi:hypothetical protein